MKARAPSIGQCRLADMITDIGGIHAAAKLLDVHPTTIRRWMTGAAPKMALMALYWETPTGRRQVETESTNVETWLRHQIAALRNENDRLRVALKSVNALSTGAANDPAGRVVNGGA